MRGSIVTVNPFRCRMWRLHDRLDDSVTEASCRAEIESISRQGQLVPALGRQLHGDAQFDVELIYGARRLFVAQHLNQPLTVEIREMTDREAILAMDAENRHRKDISPYERGLSYARFLRSGEFSSQEELARTLKVSPSQVSRLLKLTRLPSVIISAFRTPLDICEWWGLDLLRCCEHPENRAQIIREARQIAQDSRHMSPSRIYSRLLNAAARRRPSASTRDEVVKGHQGKALFRVRRQRKSIALLLPAAECSDALLDLVQRTVALLLQDDHSEIILHMQRLTQDAHGITAACRDECSLEEAS